MAAPRAAFNAYLIGLGSWFVPLGIQMVLFSWLAAIVLHMNAFYVGLAQVALMAPGILFLPLGGLVADRRNARRLLLLYHCLYALPPLVLGLVLWTGGLSYPLLIAYGLAAGSIGAFAVPTRDALLPIIAVLMNAKDRPLADVVAELPPRFTFSDRVADFPQEHSAALIAFLSHGPEIGRAHV